MIKAKCWVGHWVRFNLVPGHYDNIIDFLTYHKLSFLTEIQLDFDTIPSLLHGFGHSNNLLEYLSHNNENTDLILSFIIYFLSNITDMRYENDDLMRFSFDKNINWQTTKIQIFPIGSTLNQNVISEGALLSEDGLSYLITEDGLFAIAYEPYPGAILTEDGLSFIVTEDEQFYLQQI